MALDTLITGSNLDAEGNVKVALTQTDAYMGGARIFSENDDGSATGTALLKSPETTLDYRLRVGMDTVLFTDSFNATTQNTSNWSYTFSTLTAAQPGAGTVNFSAVQGTTNTHGAFMRTFQYFNLIGTAPLTYELTFGQFTAALVTNEVFISGFGLPSAATTIPTDGIWIQLTSAGLIGVAAFNGSTTQTGTLKSFGSIAVGQLYRAVIVVGETEVEFWLDDVLLGTLSVPVANGQPFLSTGLPAFIMKYNTGAVSNTNTIRVSDVTVTLQDIQAGKPWQIQQAIQGLSGYIGANGMTQGKTQWWTNNTAPTAAAATNTAAIAGATTLGGLVAVNPTLAANSDGILFSFQNPAGTVNITGRNLLIYGVTVQGAVSAALTGGPVVYQYAIAFGHTAASLATTETASFATGTTHAPRIAFVGVESYAATAAVGVIGQGCQFILTTPIVVRPGEFVALIARNIGTVTSAGAITVGATFDAHWD
ncbi:MAG: hypothetical protein ING20_02385 [Burkholderiales bacterium]|nr:hypothetical protein [Burkholderiales bacterium]